MSFKLYQAVKIKGTDHIGLVVGFANWVSNDHDHKMVSGFIVDLEPHGIFDKDKTLFVAKVVCVEDALIPLSFCKGCSLTLSECKCSLT